MINYFVMDESPYQPGCFTIKANPERLKIDALYSSLNVLQARFFGTDYANYLRMCRDLYCARLIGKNHLYPVAYFPNKDKAQELCNELNRRATLVMKGRIDND